MHWRELITHNLGWKVLSVVLALLIYATLDSGLQERIKPGPRRVFVQLPVRTLTDAMDGRIFRVEPPFADVTLYGPALVLDRLQPEDLDVYVKLSGGAAVDEQRKRIQVRVPSGAALVSVRPAEGLVHLMPSPHPAPVRSPP